MNEWYWLTIDEISKDKEGGNPRFEKRIPEVSKKLFIDKPEYYLCFVIDKNTKKSPS